MKYIYKLWYNCKKNMDDFIRNIKKKLSVDNIAGFKKDTKVFDDQTIKEEDVRKTLEKLDPNNIVDVDEIATKLNEITEQTKINVDVKKSQLTKTNDSSKSNFIVLQKTSTDKTQAEEDDPYLKNDNILAFFE